jgi:hypothetical protein
LPERLPPMTRISLDRQAWIGIWAGIGW